MLTGVVTSLGKGIVMQRVFFKVVWPINKCLRLPLCSFRKVLDLFGLGQATCVNTPVGAHFKLYATRDQDLEVENKLMSAIPYSNAVRSVMYSMVSTRPNIVYGIGLLSRFMAKPSRLHWQATEWLLRY